MTATQRARTCGCGCGETPPIARQSSTRKGWVKGRPVQYVAGHHTRGRHSTPPDHVVAADCPASIHGYARAHNKGCKCPGPSFEAHRKNMRLAAERQRERKGRPVRSPQWSYAQIAGERWLPVVGYPNYQVSDLGRVRSERRTVEDAVRGFTRTVGGHLLRQCVTTAYPSVRLAREGVQRTLSVHCLVLEAFVGKRPHDLEGCHNDGDRLNNALSNLRWDTGSENCLDTIRHGRNPRLHQTACVWGHPFSGENLYFGTNPKNGRPFRRCRACMKAHDVVRRLHGKTSKDDPALFLAIGAQYLAEFGVSA